MNYQASHRQINPWHGWRAVCATLLAWVLLLFASTVCRAQTETVLYGFIGVPDGEASFNGLISDSSGNLFGTTDFGGLDFSSYGSSCTDGCGTVFELEKLASGYSEHVLYRFTGISDGNKPTSGLTMDADGNLYGVTQNGGTASGPYGTVYEMVKSSTGYSYRLLYSFGPTVSNGDQPGGNLVMDATGDLFGTTSVGGSNGGGTVFELFKSAAGYTETVLYNSPSLNVGMNLGLAMDASGDLFGSTPYGGAVTSNCPNGCGAVFELVNSSGTYTYKLLYNFSGTGGDGAQPENNLVIDGSGNLYGCTSNGGPSNLGTLFELEKSSSGYTEKVLYSFAAGDPWPYNEDTGLTMDGTGDIFGTSLVGSTPGSSGSAFELVKSSSGYAEKVLWNFQGTPVDGGNSCSELMLDSLGHLFGTCSGGGVQSAGIVFEIDPSTTPTGVTLSPASVNFSTQAEGSSGLAQMVRLNNNTSSAVTISNISVTGADASDFPLAVSPFGTTCSTTNSTWTTGETSSTVPAGGTCGIFPYFAPSVAGNETATLNVTDSAGVAIAAFAGTALAPDFTVGAAPGSSSTATISPGQSARYLLSVGPVGGFNQTVTLTCMGAPSKATCMVSPSSVTLDGSNPQDVQVSVTTTAPSGVPPSLPPPNSGSWPLILWVAALGLVAIAVRGMCQLHPLGKRARLKVSAATGGFAALLLAAALSTSCGGGGGSGPTPHPGTPAGKYMITVTGTSGSLTHSTNLTLAVN